MADLSSIITEGLSFCREVEAVQHCRYVFDFGAPQRRQELFSQSVRVNHRGRIGFAWSEGQYTPSQLLQQAASNAAFGPEGDFSQNCLVSLNSTAPAQDIETAKNNLERLMQELRFTLPTVIPQRSFTINAQLIQDELSITNRLGTLHGQRVTSLLTLRSPQWPPILASSYTTATPAHPDSLVLRLIWRHCLSKTVETPNTDTAAALFSPSAAGQFWHDCIQSNWTDSTAQPARTFDTDKRLSVYEDGTLPQALGTVPFDGEGLPRQRLPLILQGKTTHALQDVICSRRAGGKAPGTAIRQWGAPPQAGYSNLDIVPGQQTPSQLCRDIGEGIWLDYLTPLPDPPPEGIFRRRANIAYLIREGQPVARLPQLIVEGSYRDMLGRDFLGLGCDTRLNGRIQAPSMAIASLRLSEEEISAQENSIDLPQLWW
ncbi:hypothetical protein IJT17_01495 [bacterium]|nr:hypothetical protein [bacterium]